jgi:hypothetical protein
MIENTKLSYENDLATAAEVVKQKLFMFYIPFENWPAKFSYIY